jgi:PAS domain S-box-containing protein
LKKDQSPESLRLRRQAEDRLREKAPAASWPAANEELPRLHHELQVHQIELELQNKELHQAKDEAEEALARFVDLYEFAPVGYVTLDPKGTILAVNLTGATLLGEDRYRLVGRPFGFFLADAQSHLLDFLHKVFVLPDKRVCEVTLKPQGKGEIYVRMEAQAVDSGRECRVALVDITDLRQEKLFHLQLECVEGFAVYLLDKQGTILNWNPGAQRMKGYRAEEIIGKNFSCLFSEKDRRDGKPEEELREAAAKGRFAEECWRIRKDGSGFWADVVLTPLRDEKGQLWGFSKVTHDITARKKVQEDLSFSEARYRALFYENPAIIFTLDARWTVISANPSALRQLGYSQEELEGQSVLNLVCPEDRAAVAEQFRCCLTTPNEVHRWQFRKRTKDGRLLWVEETGQATFGTGGIPILLVVCLDVTERKRAEGALRESEARFHAIFNLAAVGIAQVSLNGQWLMMNQKFSGILGYSFAELEHMTIQQICHPDDREPHLAHIRRLLAGEVTSYTMEKRYLHKDGSIIWVNLNVTLVRGQHGEPEYFIAIVEDISERKKADAELEAANEELEAFNYTVAHDLRQPLNIINSCCQVIEKLYGDKLEEECKEHIELAYKTTLRMDHLIEALLKFSRMGHVQPHRENVDLGMLAQEVIGSLKLAEPDREVDFRSAGGMLANGDPGLLRVVLSNLLGNAWKYTRLREKVVIEFGVSNRDGLTAYFVRDNGAGFSEPDADKLFAPFQRLPEAEKQRGFGIGLATVERIIRRHGGKVWAEGKPDQGACFFFTLPVGNGST